MEYRPIAFIAAGTVDTFTRGYLECAEWCGLYEDEQREALELSVRPQWTERAIAQAIEDCAAFQADNAADLEGFDASQSGHDFWLTRNRHGAGFWDRGLGAVGQRLTDAAHVYGEVSVWFDSDTDRLGFE